MNIGSNIRKYRKLAKITQVELAEKINKSESTIRKYEANNVEPDISTLEDIAKILDCKLIELLGYTGEYFADKANKKDKEIKLIYDFLASRYGEGNVIMNNGFDEEFIHFYKKDDSEDYIVYSKQDFEKFINHISKLFPTFKMILDSETE